MSITMFGRVLQRLDPREAALRSPMIVLGTFVLLTSVFLYGNIIAQKGGVLDNAILDPKNPTIANDAHVASKAKDGFRPTELVSFVVRFGHRGTQDDYRRVVDLTHTLELMFGNRVWSLATAPYFRDNGIEVDDTPYLTNALLQSGFDRAAWERAVAEDESVYGKLIGRDFTFAIVLLFLEPGYDETMSFRQIVELLEGRHIPWYEWWWKRSITPQDPTLGVAGWVMGRGMIDQSLNVDVFTLVAVGLTFLFLLFWNKFGSATLATIATLGIVGTSILLVRGSIGLLDLVGWPIRERVHVLLAYTNCIVQGVSFALHRYEAFRTSRGMLVDRLRASASVDGMMTLTTSVAVFGFVTLWWFAVLPMRELGVISALGVVYTLMLATVFSQSMVMLCLNRRVFVRDVRVQHGAVQAIAEIVMRRIVDWQVSMQPRRRVAFGVALLLILCMGATGVILGGRIVARSRALEYIEHSLIEETARFLNAPGRPGFDYLDLLVEPADVNVTVDDPMFLLTVACFTHDVQSETVAREVVSIATSVERVTAVIGKAPGEAGSPAEPDRASRGGFAGETSAVRRQYNLWVPESEEEAREAFFLVENKLGPALREQLWSDTGLRVSVSSSMDDSVALGEFIASVQKIALRYPGLRVTPFGKVPVYPEVDRYIREGKPWNAISSNFVFVAFMFLWLRFPKQRRTGRHIRPFLGACAMSLPFVFAGAVLIIVMGVWHVPLDVATAAITALAINAAADFAIYLVAAFATALREEGSIDAAWERAMREEGAILLLDAGLNAVCFAPLTFSHFKPVRLLGVLMMVMLAACAVGVLVIMMPVMRYLVVEKRKG